MAASTQTARNQTVKYTLKQASETIGVDPKTLVKWLETFKIAVETTPDDQRVKLISEEDVQRLSETRRQRRKGMVQAPRADTPLGSYARTVRDLRQQVKLLKEQVEVTTQQVQRLEEEREKMVELEVAVRSFEERRQEEIARMEERMERSVTRVAELAGELKARVELIRERPVEERVMETINRFESLILEMQARLAPEELVMRSEGGGLNAAGAAGERGAIEEVSRLRGAAHRAKEEGDRRKKGMYAQGSHGRGEAMAAMAALQVMTPMEE